MVFEGGEDEVEAEHTMQAISSSKHQDQICTLTKDRDSF
jgi:hypothetical protein